MPSNARMSLADVQFCTFCGDALTPQDATEISVVWPPTFPGGRRFTAGKWWACGECQNDVINTLRHDLPQKIRTRKERAWRIRQAELEGARKAN